MPLFQCQKCGCVENTALSDYWWQVEQDKKPAICSECDKGKWHGEFPKRDAVAEGYMIGADGFLYGSQEQPHQTDIIGPVRPPPQPTPPERGQGGEK